MTELEKYNWRFLHFLYKLRAEATTPIRYAQISVAIRERREILHREEAREANRDKSYGRAVFIKSNYPDYSYWEKVILPERIKTKEAAEELFLDEWFMRCMPSMYDCTGQKFTERYKIAEQGGRYVVYHEVGADL